MLDEEGQYVDDYVEKSFGVHGKFIGKLVDYDAKARL